MLDDATGEPLPWASVFLGKSQRGISTNEEGWFNWLTSILPSDTLVISYAGYQRRYIAVETLSSGDCRQWRLRARADMVHTVHITDYLTDGVDLVEQDALHNWLRPR